MTTAPECCGRVIEAQWSLFQGSWLYGSMCVWDSLDSKARFRGLYIKIMQCHKYMVVA